ncbi:glycerol-3-phosphate 1-O-acyltransferase PlsY [Alicyclobacillus acidoterrestris]|uniref:Glycerol-3-phosphate acyltransferase n=1 Tax=Alicyclobacillus acidoterrestris (strain ATCC 49025 / DSM 3922 / CIP 106132 / NCIMB 13137 / GD3B) TaxID=1356854 RepID=A0A9E6ZK30_ALIAG|nr:glycerol-3-phosphate 1-O-acyltransferase PlsY [Alicyclobacillus acidoterrestris]UNO50868.1 glycerol-3-phosphate 1-O-acyltransferase PlsY [Alicyclobacillus acidoterrestris]
MWCILSIIIAYLIGSISTSTIVVKMVSGKDIRQFGSGNAGATNTSRVLGTKWGIAVLVIDALKGMIALSIVSALAHANPVALALSAIAVVVGHNWPIYFGFRGGKGIATTIGVLLWMAPLMTIIAGILCLVVIALTRYVSLGSLIFAILIPILLGVWAPSHEAALWASIVLALLSIYSHRQNIGRLLRGSERKLFDKTSDHL